MVRRLLELGADHTAVSARGYFALDLARFAAVDPETTRFVRGGDEAATVLRKWASEHPYEAYDTIVRENDKQAHVYVSDNPPNINARRLLVS